MGDSQNEREHRETDDQPLSPEQEQALEDSFVASIRRRIARLARGTSEEVKTAEQIEAGKLRETVQEKMGKFSRTIKLNHPELREAHDRNSDAYYDFFDRLSEVCANDAEAWSLFSKFVDRYPHWRQSEALEAIMRCSKKKPDFLKLFLEVSLNEGAERCQLMAELKKPLYDDDYRKLVSTRDALMNLGSDEKAHVILENTKVYKGSLEKFSHFVDYVSRHDSFSLKEVEAYIYERMERNHPYR